MDVHFVVLVLGLMYISHIYPSTTTSENTWTSCSSSILNGHIHSSCDRLPGSECGYYCDSECYGTLNYLVCSANGLWSDAETACNCPDWTKASVHCPSTIPNGRISRNCHRRPGSRCGFSCYPGCYSNRLTMTLTCSFTYAWYSGFSACRCDEKSTSTASSVHCPLRIPNGVIQTLYGSRCDFKPYSDCSFTCDSGCYSGALTTSLKCGKTGTWTNGDTACRCRGLQSTPSTKTEQTPDGDSGYGYDRLALAIGSTVMSLVTIVTVIVIKCIFRNRRCWKNTTPPNITTTTTSNSDSTARQSNYGFQNIEFGHTNPTIPTSGYQSAAFQQTSPAITSQYGISRTPSRNVAHTSIQDPPAYHTIFEDPRGPPPAYEEATAHPLTF